MIMIRINDTRFKKTAEIINWLKSKDKVMFKDFWWQDMNDFGAKRYKHLCGSEIEFQISDPELATMVRLKWDL